LAQDVEGNVTGSLTQRKTYKQFDTDIVVAGHTVRLFAVWYPNNMYSDSETKDYHIVLIDNDVLTLAYYKGSTWNTTAITVPTEIDYSTVTYVDSFVSPDRILIADGVNRVHEIRISKEGDVSCSVLGKTRPLEKVSVDSDGSKYAISDSDVSSFGMQIERGDVLGIAYTYEDIYGQESNPSPITVYTGEMQKYPDATYDTGFKYYWTTAKYDNLTIPETLTDQELEDISKFKIYRTNRATVSGAVPFTVYNLSGYLDINDKVAGKAYTYYDNTNTGGTISYEKDVAPVANCVTENSGYVFIGGSKEDFNKKLPFEFDHIYKVKISNPNAETYAGRPLHIFLDEDDFDSMELDHILYSNLDKIRFIDSDLTTPIECAFAVNDDSSATEVVITANNALNKATDYVLGQETGGVAWQTIVDGTNEYPMAQHIYANDPADTAHNWVRPDLNTYMTTGHYYTITVRGEALTYPEIESPRIRIVTRTAAGVFYSTSDWINVNGIFEETFNIDMSGAAVATNYIFDIEADNLGYSIKPLTYCKATQFDSEPTYTKAHIFLKPNEIKASQSKTIYMCYNETGNSSPLGTYWSNAIHGKPINLRTSWDLQTVFEAEKPRYDSIYNICCDFENESQTADQIDDLQLFKQPFEKTSGSCSITDNTEDSIFFPYRIGQTLGGYKYIIGSTSAYSDKTDYDYWTDPANFTIATSVKITSASLATSYTTGFIIDSNDYGAKTGWVLSAIKNSTSNDLRIVFKIWDGFLSANYEEITTIDATSFTTLNLFIVCSINGDTGSPNLFVFDLDNKQVIGSKIDTTGNYTIEMCDSIGFGGSQASSALDLTAIHNFILLKDIVVNTPGQAISLLRKMPIYSSETIGAYKEELGVTAVNIDVNTTSKYIDLLTVDYSSIFTENSVIMVIDDSGAWGGIYQVTSDSVFSTNTRVYCDDLPTSGTGSSVSVTIYGYSLNHNITFEEMTADDIITDKKNIIKWSGSDGGSIPDLNFRNTNEAVVRVINAPSFLISEYENTVLAFMRNGIQRFVMTTDSTDWRSSPRNLIDDIKQYGLFAKKTLRRVGNALYWLAEEGIIRWDARGLTNISKNKVLLDDVYGEDARSVYIPTKNQYWIIEPGETPYYKEAVVYDIILDVFYKFTGLDISEFNDILDEGADGENLLLFVEESSSRNLNTYPGTNAGGSPLIKTKNYEIDNSKYVRLKTVYDEHASADNKVTTSVTNRNGTTSKDYTGKASRAWNWLSSGSWGDYIQFTVENFTKIKQIVLEFVRR